MNEVRPGDMYTAHCPEGSLPQVKVGDLIPGDKPMLVVLRVQDRDIVLGPLKGGQLTLTLPCTNNQNAAVEFQLTPLKKEDLPERAPPLMPFEASFPLWLWILLGLVLAGLIAASIFTYKKIRRKLVPPKPPKLVPQATPAQKLEAFLREAKKAKWVESSDESAVQLLYGQGYEGLRKYLEAHYRLKTLIETTREFLTSLRALAPQLGLSSQVFDKIEFCLLQADAVRFAKENPPGESRKQFFKYIEDIFETVRPRAAELAKK